MRAVIQRVSSASVEVDGKIEGSISRGILLYLGIADGDNEKDLEYMVRKIVNSRIFPDDAGKMNRSLIDVRGELLLIGQFTLCADTDKGNRPSFNRAADPEIAILLYEEAVARFKTHVPVSTGIFGASMKVYSRNEGPVTILYDSRK